MYCINPICPQRDHPHRSGEECPVCGTPWFLASRYKVLTRIAQTQQTEVFAVENLAKTPFILKVLNSTDPKRQELFEREYVVLSVLNHPNIPHVDIDDYFTISTPTGLNLQCLVIERIEGETLEAWSLSNGRMSERTAINWIKQMVAPGNAPGVLAYLHQNHIVHRDIKPSNLILRPNGEVALIDFGGVRDIQAVPLREADGQTRNPTIISSPGYSPPEQFNGQALLTSDFFALGRTWVQLLTGQRPLDLIDPAKNQLRWHHLTQISKPFANWLDSLMSDVPERRPSSTEIIYEDLTLRLPKQIRTSRIVNSWAFKAGMAIAVLGLIGGGIFGYTAWRADQQLQIANQYLQRGIDNLRKGNVAQARTEFEAAVKADDRSSAAHNNLGLACYYQYQNEYQNNDQCAIEQFKRAIALDPKNWEAYNNLGGLYDRQKRYDLAADQYKIAANGPNNLKAEAISNLARLRILERRYQEAETLLREAVGLTNQANSLAAIHKNLGWVLFELKRYSEAQTELETARSLDKTRVDTLCLLAFVKSAQKIDAYAEAQACKYSVPTLPLPEIQEWRNQLDKQKF